MEFSVLEYERAVLALLFRTERFYLSLISGDSSLKEDCFCDDTHALIFRESLAYYVKYKARPTKKIMLGVLKRKLKSDRNAVTACREVLKRLRKTKAKSESFPFYVDELVKMSLARQMYGSLKQEANLLDQGDMEGLRAVVKSQMMSLEGGRSKILTGGEVTSDFGERLEIVEYKEKNPKSGISGMLTKLPMFDNVTGGVFPGELAIALAITGVGKSLFLLDVGYKAALVGRFVVHVTIEMDKWKAQTRFDSRLTRIPFQSFKFGKLTTKQKRHWEKRLTRFHSKGGIYYVMAFRGRTCKVPVVEAELRKLQDKFGRRVDMVTWDYLNDVSPVGRYSNDRDWTALGEISWDMKQLAKDFNMELGEKKRGIVLWTANQARHSAYGKERLGVRDFAYSPLPSEHAQICVYIAETAKDKRAGVLHFGIFKNRDADSNTPDTTVLFRPNYDVCMIHDPRLEK